jgi:hypothetical protein
MTDKELADKLADIDAELTKIWTLHGLPRWEVQERQRLDNQKSQATRLPFSPSQAHGEVYRPKPHEGQK